MRLIENILSTIAPHQCIGCAAEGSILCGECRNMVVAAPPRCYRCQRLSDDYRTCNACRRSSPLFAVRAVTSYDLLAKEIVHRLKYERTRAAADTLAEFMAPLVPFQPGLVLTHVPTASQRMRARGYDQAQLIARHIAVRSGVAYTPLLARLGQERQVGKNRKERLRQMRETFEAKRRHASKEHVLLIDDVITTGATLEAAATILKDAGVRRVSALVFAAA